MGKRGRKPKALHEKIKQLEEKGLNIHFEVIKVFRKMGYSLDGKSVDQIANAVKDDNEITIEGMEKILNLSGYNMDTISLSTIFNVYKKWEVEFKNKNEIALTLLRNNIANVLQKEVKEVKEIKENLK